MGGWDLVLMFLTGALFTKSYKIEYTQNIPDSNSLSLQTEFEALYPQPEYSYYDRMDSNVIKPLINSIYWIPTVRLEHTIDLLNTTEKSNASDQEHSTNSVNLVDMQSYKHDVINKEGNSNSSQVNEEIQIKGNHANEEALGKQTEELFEDEYHHQKDASENNQENQDKETNNKKQLSTEANHPTIPGKSTELAEDYRGESSDYGHHSYVQFNEGGTYDNDNYEPKMKQEIHYHQHKHLHEHEHLQDHKHQHLDEHKAKHQHEHMENENHKHNHEAKHQHQEKSEHYHKENATHKHNHYQEHKHEHKNEHKHDHQHEAKHEHKGKHEHNHKENAKHNHEIEAQHNHNHQHKHEENGNHYHNHWSENKHWHDHNYYQKPKVYYVKRLNYDG